MAGKSPSPVIVIDNGGGTIKFGLAGESEPRAVFTNGVGKCKSDKKVYIGHKIDECQDIAALSVKRPVDRGYVMDWSLQADIWQRAFNEICKRPTKGSHVVVTEPMFNFRQLQESMCQTLFEDLGVASFVAGPPPAFALRHHNRALPQGNPAKELQTGLVVDCGYSFAHVVPVVGGQAMKGAAKRVNIGGKLMTNLMKEMVSYRSVNMMEETFLMDVVKEATCLVSHDVVLDLDRARRKDSPFRLEYVLPDGLTNIRGYIRDVEKEREAEERAKANGMPPPKPPPEEQILPLNNERFMVPETVFRPSDIGMTQAGITEACLQAVTALGCSKHGVTGAQSDVQGLLWSNVVLTGGVCSCPGFLERFTEELRPMVPDAWDLNVSLAHGGPTLAAWRGASDFASDWGAYQSRAVTKKMYEEMGSERLLEAWRFQFPYTPNSPVGEPPGAHQKSIYADDIDIHEFD